MTWRIWCISCSKKQNEDLAVSKREQWVDRLKFWGMLAIYIGHFYEWGGVVV